MKHWTKKEQSKISEVAKGDLRKEELKRLFPRRSIASVYSKIARTKKVNGNGKHSPLWELAGQMGGVRS